MGRPYSKTEHRKSTIGSSIILTLRVCKTTNHNDGNNCHATKRYFVPIWEESHEFDGSIVPCEMHGLCDDSNGDVKEKYS